MESEMNEYASRRKSGGTSLTKMIESWRITMTKKTRATKFMAFAALLFVVGGCTQIKPIPGYARAGDLVVLGLGGIHRNAGSNAVLRADDLTVTITDALANTYDVEPQFVFKSFPDYNAALTTTIVDNTDGLAGLDLTLFDGGWFVLVPLNVVGDPETPLPLAVGMATVSITSPKLINTAATSEGDMLSLPLEIIPGTSTLDADYMRQFISYIPGINNFVIAPDDLTGVNSVGGAFYVIEYYDDSIFQNGLEPMVVPSNHNPFVQLSYNVISNGNGTGKIQVTLLNPAGFTSQPNAAVNTSLLADLDVKLMYFSTATSAVAKTKFSLDSASSYYIDINGDVIPSVDATMTHAVDL
ncbi:MAG: hypothetical protein ACJAZ0_000195 [Halioglobus sp.]|jgi:hypothetical protein